MNKTSVAITTAFCVAIGFLIARFIGPTEAPESAKVEKAVVAAPAPVPQRTKVFAPKAVTTTPTKRPPMDEATRARIKAFAEETKQMALELAGGDEKKLSQAVRNGMINPASAELMRRGREIGEAFRTASTDAEREVLTPEVASLREQAFGIIREEIAKIDAGAAPAPAAPAPAAPATVVPAQGLM